MNDEQEKKSVPGPVPRVLVVDDQPPNIHLLAKVLADGHQVLAATGGAEALAICRSPQPPDLVLLDVVMPELDGYEVCRRLKADGATAGIPVIFVTARDSAEDEEAGFAVGAMDYISKPFNPAIVRARVRNHLELQRKTRDLEQKKAELTSSNNELEQFAYAVSHDLRQPLRMISSYLQLLESRMGSNLGVKELEFMNQAVGGAKRLDRMIVGLLEYSRVGRVREQPALFNSRDALEQALAFLQPASEESGARLQISGDWPQVMASPDELTRLFQNLIGNALKYVPHATRPEIRIHSSVLPHQWQVAIKDNGIGIDPSQQYRLFKVFSRLQSRADYEGSGIGLAICRKIVEQHHGELWVESLGPGQGSTFQFIIPLRRPRPINLNANLNPTANR